MIIGVCVSVLRLIAVPLYYVGEVFHTYWAENGGLNGLGLRMLGRSIESRS